MTEKRNGIGFIALVLSLVLWPSTLLSQEVIENPERPLAKNGGRIIELEEIWRITDERGQFYFKRPGQLQIAADGTIFLSDEGQFLRFSADGKFIANIYRKGEGPGEIGGGLAFFIVGNELIIRNSDRGNIWSADYEGNMLREYEIRIPRDAGIIGVRESDFVLARMVTPPPNERTGKMKIPRNVFLSSADGKNERPIHTFFSEQFMTPQAGRFWGMAITMLSPDGKHIVGYHGFEYLIQIVDIERGKIVRAFNRKYRRVKHVEDQYEREFNKRYGAPTMEYESDVRGMKLNPGRIWARTSTTDPNKGDLWDVFDMDGRFLDSFYLGPGRTLLRAGADEIYVSEQMPDETIAVVKYKIVG
jgi:hypothetical protein